MESDFSCFDISDADRQDIIYQHSYGIFPPFITIFCRFTIGVTGEISLSHECASYRQKAMLQDVC